MKITIEFKTDNAAFQDGNEDDEITNIMKRVTSQVVYGYREGQVVDSNGNHVGYWTKEVE